MIEVNWIYGLSVLVWAGALVGVVVIVAVLESLEPSEPFFPIRRRSRRPWRIVQAISWPFPWPTKRWKQCTYDLMLASWDFVLAWTSLILAAVAIFVSSTYVIWPTVLNALAWVSMAPATYLVVTRTWKFALRLMTYPVAYWKETD